MNKETMVDILEMLEIKIWYG